MSTVVVQNDEMKVGIESLGAELQSLVDKKTGKEYMWSADPAYWGKCSPILFPFVGGTRNKKFVTKGKTYTMTQHGFARGMEFELTREAADEVWFAISSNEETLAKYPYAFRLESGYRLMGRTLRVLWRVHNPADEVLYFSIGGHPAFRCPFEPGEELTEQMIKFGDRKEISTSVISPAGLATDERKTYQLKDSRLPITGHTFDQDALVLEEKQVQEISLCRADGSPYVTVTFDVPLFGVWSMPNAPFVCIEPWYGRCDHENFTGTLAEREYGNVLEPGGTWEAFYDIHI